MKRTFCCDDSMIITIPIGSLKDVREGQLMPDKFHCVFRDSYKVFAIHGKPRPLGAAQGLAGVFLLTLGLIFSNMNGIFTYTLPSVVFMISGMLTFAAGKFPNMHLTKLSFSLNIISFFWSVAAFSLCVSYLHKYSTTHSSTEATGELHKGIHGLIMSLLVVETFTALFLIYWLSKAVCRQHFNSLPTILLKLGD
ncbi:membrane-spanning 4-domains subfamily A member 4A [Salarias fasciatus]|uniref:membrane-spanning 4-domains subfamily A member 4A n=1 Tax=Salarias fasciatus TaxID=181472 RepID=UPI0011766AE7|nr:membrane-spanning 4-domains subfamily A member 4A-like [Salarias fasciatus]